MSVPFPFAIRARCADGSDSTTGAAFHDATRCQPLNAESRTHEAPKHVRALRRNLGVSPLRFRIKPHDLDTFFIGQTLTELELR